MTELPANINVSICICTFRRPELLANLLSSLSSQLISVQHNSFVLGGVEVIVVDNDPYNSALPVLTQAQCTMGNQLIGLHAPVPNISLARNLAVHQARGVWVVMMDDDEIPAADWIVRLIEAQQTYQADVVFGPVLVHYADGVSAWLQQGAYFERRRLVTGTRVEAHDARSGNVLIRRSALVALCPADDFASGPFDPEYGRTGGEDSILFRELGKRGAVMVWCDEATVSELVPVERATANWLLQRSYRTGQLYLRAELYGLSGQMRWKKFIGLSLRALVQGVAALVLTLVCLPFSRHRAFFWLRTASSQTGKLSVWAGSAVQSYGHSPT